MFKWLKLCWFRSVATASKCQHTKEACSKYPDNMVAVIKFSPYKNGDKSDFPYGVAECANCGKRSFLCTGLHMMGDEICKRIDKFILYKITLDELKADFKHLEYRIEGNDE